MDESKTENALIRHMNKDKGIPVAFLTHFKASNVSNDNILKMKALKGFVDNQIKQPSLLQTSTFRSKLPHSRSHTKALSKKCNFRRKCIAVYIGGDIGQNDGESTLFKSAPCSRIRCTKCNYLVSRFCGKFGL